MSADHKCPRCGNTDRAKMEIRSGVAEYCVTCHSCMRPCCNRSLRAPDVRSQGQDTELRPDGQRREHDDTKGTR